MIGARDTRMIRKVVALGVLLMLVAVSGEAARTAEAAFPGANGKIVFVSNRAAPDNPEGDVEVFTMDPDGSNIEQLTKNSADEREPAFSPDGAKIAFASSRDGNSEIYTMNTDGTNQTNITNNPANDLAPAFSPDGQQIAFARESQNGTNSEIYTMSATGGNQTNITNNGAYDFEPAWSPDGTRIVFTRSSLNVNSEIYAMDTTGANQTNLTNNGAAEQNPAFSPDGEQIAFTTDRDGNSQVYTMDADGANPINRSANTGIDYDPAFSPDGARIAFASFRDGTYEIYTMDADGANQTNITNNSAHDFQPDWQAVTGADTTPPAITTVSPADNATGVTRATNVTATFSEAMDEASVEAAGVVRLVGQGQTNAVAASVNYDAATRKVTLDPNADLQSATHYVATVTTGAKDEAGNPLAADKTWTFRTAGFILPPFIPPTPPIPPIPTIPIPTLLENQIVFTSSRVTPDNPTGDFEIFVMRFLFFGGTDIQQITKNNANDSKPSWSPDGRRIAFASERDGNSEIYTMNADGTNQTRLTNNAASDGEPTRSPNGQKIAFQSSRGLGGDIWTMNANGTSQTNLTRTGRAYGFPDFSPNGALIAFSSDLSRERDIYTIRANGTNLTNLTNDGDAAHDGEPAWSLNGQKIAFVKTVGATNREIFTMNANGRNQTRLTNNAATFDLAPVWSPSGTQIAFSSDRDGNFEIYTMRANGTSQINRTNDPALDSDPDWTVR